MVDVGGETSEVLVNDPVSYHGTHKCLYANIRGLKQGAGELAAVVETDSPHFVFLTECHIAPDEPINMCVPCGYKPVAKRWRSAHGGGLLILAQDHLLCDPFGMDDYHVDESVELIAMQYGGVVYIAGYSNKSSVCVVMIDVLKQLKEDHPLLKFVIVGDFNIHNECWLHSVSGTDTAGELMEEFAQLNGMYQLVDFPTCGHNTLDLIMTDFPGTAVESPHLGSSDHVAVKFEIQVEQKIPCVEQPSSRNWKKAPWDHIRGDLKRALHDWSPDKLQSMDSVEAELDEIMWTVVNKHVKMRAPTKPRSRPWWNSECERALKRKVKAFHTRRDHPMRYRNAKKRCSRIQRRAFAIYNQRLSKQLSEMEKSDKTFWNLTKQISGLQPARNKAAPNADKLADHFASKMSNAANKFDNDWKPSDKWNAKAKLSSFKVHHRDVLKQLKSLDTNKSINGIPYMLLKECAQQLYEPLTKLYRFICQRGEFPQSWKIGRITALHKRGAISDPKLYRPVQVLVNGELVFEGVIGPQLFKFLMKYIPESQFGFIKKCGTQDYGALLVLLIFSTMEEGGEVLVISLDVAGAFDKVWHAGLLKKLTAAGMSGRALKLMRSYLHRRFIKVVVGADSSKERRIYSSVPQGGKWSAPLWDFEISTLVDLDLSGLLMSYADDCSLVYQIYKSNRHTVTLQLWRLGG